MQIQENINLSKYTTFKIGGFARFFCIVTSEDDVLQAVDFARSKNIPFFVLGGGSNILISDNGYSGLVIKNEISGIEIVKEDDGVVVLEVGAGMNWDEFVEYTVNKEYSGLENLSYIPGVVGASPVQNIGAYGREASTFIHTVKAFDVGQSKFVELTKEQCEFSYRNSLFKKNKGRHIITTVSFTLNKKHSIDISYKDLKEYFFKSTAGQTNSITIKDVREAVIEIRKNKLPDWKTWGTAGSFFKNPIISKEQFDHLKSKYPDLPGFEEGSGVKVSLGWILDKVCGMKGASHGNVGTYEKQALVLVSRPGATAEDVTKFSQNIMQVVKDKTGIDIEAEVEWVN